MGWETSSPPVMEAKRGSRFRASNTSRRVQARLVPVSYTHLFLSERSKILPRRTTGTCAMHQRQLTEAIKRARQIALLPFVTD